MEDMVLTKIDPVYDMSDFRQATVWTSDGQRHWRIYVLFGVDELINIVRA